MTEERPDRLSIVIWDGHFDRVHYALVMASGAAAAAVPVTLFFTMGATRALLRDQGWKSMPLSLGQGHGELKTGADLDGDYAAKGVATFEEMLEACSLMGVRVLVCEMGLRAANLERSALRDDITIELGGVVSFVNGASAKGSMLFI